MIERLKELSSQKQYNSQFDRCNHCQNWQSYYFDEYDADAWCDLELDNHADFCYSFKTKDGE